MSSRPTVSIVMGSQSDWKTMKSTSKVLKSLKVLHEIKIVSAHRTPKRMFDFAENAERRGIKIIIAGAGGAAHLPGMISSISNRKWFLNSHDVPWCATLFPSCFLFTPCSFFPASLALTGACRITRLLPLSQTSPPICLPKIFA